MTRVNALGTSPLSIDQGGTAVSVVTIAPTASAWAGWDANSNFSANSFLTGYTATPTAGATTTLTVASANVQVFTGITTQTVVMPVTSTLVIGQPYIIINLSTGAVTVQSSGGDTIQVMARGTKLSLICISTSGTTAASWHADYSFTGGGVDAITGTANQLLVNGDTAPHTGDVTLTLPQNIATTSNVTFGSLTATNLTFDVTANTIASTNTNGNINLIPNGSGGTLIGSSTAITGLQSSLQIAAGGQVPILVAGAYKNTTGGFQQQFYKSRSTTIGSFVTVNSGDTLGATIFNGDDGTQFKIAASMVVTTQGTISTGVVPGQYVWSTTNTSGVLTTGMTLTNAQILTLANPLPAGSGGTGVASLGTGVATALGQNVTGSGGIVLANTPTFVTGTVTMPSVTFSSTSGIIGTTTNNNAAAGSVGELISSVIPAASAVSLTNNTSAAVTSISLTAGDWHVYGNISLNGGATTLLQYSSGFIGNNSIATPDPSLWNGPSLGTTGVAVFAENQYGYQVPFQRISLATTTTIYLGVIAGFTLSTCTAAGGIYAIRAR